MKRPLAPLFGMAVLLAASGTMLSCDEEGQWDCRRYCNYGPGDDREEGGTRMYVASTREDARQQCQRDPSNQQGHCPSGSTFSGCTCN